MGVYKLKTTGRGSRPRSKRLREQGAAGNAGGSTVVNVSGGGAATPSIYEHWHDNKAALDQLSTDAEGYAYLTRLIETLDDENNDVYERLTEKIKAGSADVATTLAEDSPVREWFLSKIADDVARGNITFEKAIDVMGAALLRGGATFGRFNSSLQFGTGANINASGNAEFESVRVRSYFECAELIINRLSAIEGDMILTENDTVERIVTEGAMFGLYLRQKWEGYTTALVVGDVIKGINNTMRSGSGTYQTCWMRVEYVIPANNYIEVSLFPASDVPAGVNYRPGLLMKIARWGSQTDRRRQSCLYLSSTEGRIVHLTGVTKPIVDASNYGATFGTLPDFLKSMNLPTISGQDYVYARGLVVQDMIRVDYQGKPESEVVDRGAWKPEDSYYCQDLNRTTGRYEISDVWHYGCRYRCAKTGTTTEPCWGNTDWAMIEGNPEFTVSFAESDAVVDPANFSLTLSIVARCYNTDVTAQILDKDVVWTRYSEDANGIARIDSDATFRRTGKTITLTPADCDFSDDGTLPKVMRFIATVTLRTAEGTKTAKTE